jgi:hypothetical protein
MNDNNRRAWEWWQFSLICCNKLWTSDNSEHGNVLLLFIKSI